MKLIFLFLLMASLIASSVLPDRENESELEAVE